ncbi:MAG: SsrA-binding protein SmpB [Methanoregulaceae archaeon]|jgi:SsrA-binding protein|nr:SsrA-binding protein SmpB [Methanoregulaceae archaeon]
MANSKSSNEPRSIVNRKARHDYELLDTWEAGIALVGSEVKSIWLGRVNMVDAFVRFHNGEAWLMELDIEPYEHATAYKPERRRDRKLLLHAKEIALIDRRALEKGLTIVPTRIYFKNGRVKVEIALARGKKQYDKRQQLAKDDARREVERLRSGKF